MDGQWWMWLAGYELPRSLEQTLTGLTSGATYGVTFIMASEGSLSDSLFVSADGGPAVQFTAPPYSGNFWDTWVQKEFTFTASGSTATILFSTFGIDPTSQFDIGIDNIHLHNCPPSPNPPRSPFSALASRAWRAAAGGDVGNWRQRNPGRLPGPGHLQATFGWPCFVAGSLVEVLIDEELDHAIRPFDQAQFRSSSLPTPPVMLAASISRRTTAASSSQRRRYSSNGAGSARSDR